MKIKLIVATALVMFSCKNRIDEIPVSEEALTNAQLADSQIDKKNTASLFQQNTAPMIQTSSATSGAVLNPPHGQPGHRCDIAVGAPLPDTGVITSEQKPISQGEPLPQVSDNTNSQQAVNQQVTYNSKGEKLNPPHGQPGHRCDIPVGAPLSSKPAATTQPSTQVAEQQIVVQPQTGNTVTGVTAAGFSGKPNPPHGQEGHRCDIAVGAILP